MADNTPTTTQPLTFAQISEQLNLAIADLQAKNDIVQGIRDKFNDAVREAQAAKDKAQNLYDLHKKAVADLLPNP